MTFWCKCPNFFLCRFIRFCTLEEAKDAVSELNGSVLGNKAIVVELASETRERLAGEEEENPLSGE